VQDVVAFLMGLESQGVDLSDESLVRQRLETEYGEAVLVPGTEVYYWIRDHETQEWVRVCAATPKVFVNRSTVPNPICVAIQERVLDI
jgi:hypothetical protein